ncbi:hypothetical protein [Bifidobacterium pseudolongum]|uniref:hypothetical protein n=1 Tax=Bifidobacterium pseudolongum TaxID=1694 RepID=UPI0013EAEAFE|nr:hypothetical protein [Bifidobacterium pseudolongum]
MTPWPHGSAGELSVVLAMKFGCTPWQWRKHALNEDWATAVRILEQEAQRVQQMNRK